MFEFYVSLSESVCFWPQKTPDNLTLIDLVFEKSILQIFVFLILKGFNNGFMTDMILICLQKVFDTICHDLL